MHCKRLPTRCVPRSQTEVRALGSSSGGREAVCVRVCTCALPVVHTSVRLNVRTDARAVGLGVSCKAVVSVVVRREANRAGVLFARNGTGGGLALVTSLADAVELARRGRVASSS